MKCDISRPDPTTPSLKFDVVKKTIIQYFYYENKLKASYYFNR